MSNTKAYEVVTERILALLAQGVAPWRKPWRGPSGAPRNLVSDRPYRGINSLLLGCLGYSDPRFLTFRQALDAGGCVRKGEKGFPVVFFSVVGEDKEAQKRGYALIRYSTAFNAAQCDNLPALPVVEEKQHDPIEAAEAIVRGYTDCPKMRVGAPSACYSPSSDEVRVPALPAFNEREEYYSTLFHELGHSTGHQSRLARKGVTDLTSFGSHAYSKEELVAEMTACFLCAEAGIEAATIENSAAYLDNWIKRLKGDPKLVCEAAGLAQKAADWVRGRAAEKQEAA